MEALMKRYARLPLIQHKPMAILAMVLVCMAVVTLMAYQIHAVASVHEHSVPGGHHQSPLGSSACLSAVLPAATLLIVFSSLWFSAAVVSWLSDAPVVLPYKPPKSATP
jgi:hypothetical protein